MKMNTVMKQVAGAAKAPAAMVHNIKERRVSAVLSQYPKEAMVTCHCRDCSLETVTTASELILDKGVGGLTPDELAARLRCERESCGGPVDVQISWPG